MRNHVCKRHRTLYECCRASSVTIIHWHVHSCMTTKFRLQEVIGSVRDSIANSSNMLNDAREAHGFLVQEVQALQQLVTDNKTANDAGNVPDTFSTACIMISVAL